jgi:hypothetical protein
MKHIKKWGFLKKCSPDFLMTIRSAICNESGNLTRKGSESSLKLHILLMKCGVMPKLNFLLLLCVFIGACSRDPNSTTTSVTPSPPPAPKPILQLYLHRHCKFYGSGRICGGLRIQWVCVGRQVLEKRPGCSTYRWHKECDCALDCGCGQRCICGGSRMHGHD